MQLKCIIVKKPNLLNVLNKIIKKGEVPMSYLFHYQHFLVVIILTFSLAQPWNTIIIKLFDSCKTSKSKNIVKYLFVIPSHHIIFFL